MLLAALHALQFLRAVPGRIAKRPPVRSAVEEPLLKETVHRRHDGCIRLPDRDILSHFMNGGTSPAPHRLEDLSLERSELGPESSFEEGTKRVHFVDDKRVLEALAEQLTPCGEIRRAPRRYTAQVL